MKKTLSLILVLAMLLSVAPVLEVTAAEETTTTWKKVDSLEAIGDKTFAITITYNEATTYVLPVVQSGNATGSQDIPEISEGVEVDGNTLTITSTEYTFGWKLEQADGGYHIKADDDSGYYLYVAESNNAIRIYKKNPTTVAFVWNILDCGLLGAYDNVAAYRTLCVDLEAGVKGWSSYTTADKTETGKANSKVIESNVLGLWVLDNGTSEEPDCTHDWKGATCTEPKTCSVCKATEGEALGHDWDEGVVTEDSTCAEQGVKTYTCKNDATHTKTEAVDINGEAHKWNDGVVTKDPTCTEEGVKTYTCLNNENHTKTEPVAIDEDAHFWNEGEVTKQPTCSAEGEKTFTCNHNKEHTKVEKIDADPTAHTDIDKNGVCDDCEKNCCDHEYDTAVTAPTCENKGYTTYSCTKCSHSYDGDYVDALGHSWNDGEQTKDPTCSAKGEMTYTCENDPTHTKTEDVAIDENAHAWNDGEQTKAPTCSAEGEMTYTCEHNAIHTKTEDVAIDDEAHKWDEGVVTKEPTCKEKGVKTYTCENDPTHTYTEDVATLDHDWVDATYEAPKTCSVCGATEGDPLPASPTPEGTYWLKVKGLADIGEDDQFVITVTIDGVTYVLPNAEVNKKADTPTNAVQGTVSEDGRFLTMDETAPDCNFTLVPAENGYYYIMSGENYLWMYDNDQGLRINAADQEGEAPTVWKVYACGLLGSQDASGNYRALCVRDSLWKTFKTTGNVEDGAAHSSVRDNELGLWVLKTNENACEHEDIDPADHKCDTCGETLTQCADKADDGDHKCDICGKDSITDHADENSDNLCDECEAVLCDDNSHINENNDHKCDVCGKPVSECADNEPKDHKCDVCGEVLTECKDSDTDTDHACDTCGEVMEDCADAKGDRDHKCDVCGKDGITEHTWADATIEAPKTCTECGATEGDPLPLSPTPEGTYWLKVEDLADIGEDDKLVITITIDGVTYVLPTDTVKNKEQAPGIDLLGEISEDGRFLTMDDTNPDCNWTVVPTTGGYYIMSGSNYLWVDAGDTGLRVTATDAPTVWKVYACGLLGSQDASGNYRTLCIRDGLWKSFKTTGNVEDGVSHSTVRNNVLGLWKLSTSHTCADADKDHKCDTCGAAVSQCADANKDHKCDICGKVLTPCADADGDSDHKCDICGEDWASSHRDANGDNVCDECGSTLCADGNHVNENKDHLCDVCGSRVSSCTDKEPVDHKCDICGKVLGECADAEDDADHKCDVCGKDGMNECTDADDDADHKCEICGKDGVSAHVWVDATIEAPKTCSVCGATEGDPLPQSPAPESAHGAQVEKLDDIAKNEKMVITITIDGVTYILPTDTVRNSASAPNLDHQAEITEDGRFVTVDGDMQDYTWTVIPTEGGFYLKSGSNYLLLAAGDTGLRINTSDDPTVWNIYDCGLLGAQDENGNHRVLCIRDGLWKTFKTTGNTASGTAHSTVRNNELGLWKYVAAKGGSDSSPETGDSFISIAFAALLISGLSVVALIPKKKF